MADLVVILITASSDSEATKIADALVKEHLVACVNIVPGVRSVFSWQGKTEDAFEVLMVCKSRLILMDRIIHRVKALHSYSVPEIIAVPVTAGSKDYLDWVQESTVNDQERQVGGPGETA